MTKKITVFGSFVVDLSCRVPHLPARGETVRATTFAMGPGGKGSNQAVAARRCGADVTVVTKVGADELARVARDSFTREGMDLAHVYEDPDWPTASALIMVGEDTGDNQIAVYLGACEHFTAADVERARPALEGCDVLLVQLETNLEATVAAVDVARERPGVTVVLNPAPACPLPDDFLAKVDVLTPNETEASLLTGVRVESVDDAREAAMVLLEKGVGAVIVTLGEKGALLVTGDREEFIGAVEVDAVDTTGAGDAYNGGLVTALAEGKDLLGAARFANVVGALSVTRHGTAPAMPHRGEVDRFFRDAYS
ncbi:MAG: ribokinase [Promethearchaeota archaeon]